MTWLFTLLLTAASVPVVVVAGRDLRLNWNAVNPDTMNSWAHGRARAGAVAFAVTAPLLVEVSIVMAAVFWAIAALFVFVLLPNRVLTDPPATKRKTTKKTRKRGGGEDR